MHETVVTSVPCLTSILYYNKEPIAKACGSQQDNSDLSTSERMSSGSHAKEESVCMWKALQCSYFRKKPIELSGVKWRKNFFDLLSLRSNPLDASEKELVEDGFLANKNCLVLPSKKISNKPDPIYSGFGKLRNGFYVSSNGLVFSSETEVHNLACLIYF